MREKREGNQLPLLHVYPHYVPSEEVVLVGNRLALNRLKKAIEQALARGEAESEQLSTALLEPYSIRVIVNEEKCDDPFWLNLKLPFAELEDANPKALDQYDLLSYNIIDSESLKRMEPEIEKDRTESEEMTELVMENCRRNSNKDKNTF
ncbi:hypothetical protein [Evansella cellulosilytica]|uniref:Uncharacterized protein n=1 Tax=Evansella cellulosilytica (strain ATCC 21833 / DSM 2522 / FERM P-1141 / JCM 9156 / N-4) TaxID=649639 RepID=E6TU25_EVAC2|nr:hypothetical protein [Evansella cellulosilytica]ADU28485.1 hypothetical protein Bcell_0196 [Evansella cellulosilytica DSM 2522]